MFFKIFGRPHHFDIEHHYRRFLPPFEAYYWESISNNVTIRLFHHEFTISWY